MEKAMNFREQAEKYMSDIVSEVRPNTLAVYRSILNARIVPLLGEEDLAGIDSATAKLLKEVLVKANLSPATVNLAVWLLKQVVESATDARGNRLFAPAWNNDFIRLPKVNPATQKAPITPAKALGEAVQRTSGEVKALIALLGGTGLRIGEALALGVGTDWQGNIWDPEAGTVKIRATMVRGTLQAMPKTEAGNRTVDLAPELNRLLTVELGGKTGRLFQTPLRSLYRRIHEQNIEGFHSLRRRRLTDLQMSNVPTPLTKYWAGHAAENVTERYAKVGSEISARKTWSEKTGLGFQI